MPLAVVGLILPSSISRAATFTVTKTADTNGTCNSGLDCSLREAIKAANDETHNPGPDTIVFAAGGSGTVALSSALPNISTDINLQGPGAHLLEVTRTQGLMIRIFAISNGTSSGPTVTISGIAINNGHASFGDDPRGGGVLNEQGTLTMSDCILSGNAADSDGGGVYNEQGTLTISNCILTGNFAIDGGGGIYNASGTLTVQNSSITGFGSNLGGGIFNVNGTTTVRNCTLSGNSAKDGGGIFNVNGTTTARNCTLSGNSASDAGGGIYNDADDGGANATVSNSTLGGNSASNGGGIYNTGAEGGTALVSLDNTILASTSDMPSANLVNVGLGTSITSGGYNLSSDDGGGFLTSGGDQINTNPQLGPLQDNGGPTATMALLPGSPAQDTGKNFGMTTDQRGLPRPIDVPTIPNASGGDGSDIGAVEMQTAPTFIVTTTADHDDGACSATDCTLREAINAANAAGGAGIIIFGNGVTGVITLQSAPGTLTVTESVRITGPGAPFLAVSGNEALRVLTFRGGSSSMSGLTIRDGWLAGNSGDGLSRAGGGIHNQGTLTVNDCAFDNNFVNGANNVSSGGIGGAGQGGGIFNGGTLTLNRCTFGAGGPSFSGNGAVGGSGGFNGNLVGVGGGGGAGQGGAVFNDTSGTLTVTNCTFNGNAVGGGQGGNGHFGGKGGDASGGAVFNQGTMTMTATTVSGNVGSGGLGGTGNPSFVNNGSPGAGRGGLAAGGGTSLIGDTISAGNTGNRGGGPDVDGTFTSGGYNLIGIGDSRTGFTGTGDQVGTTAAPLNANLGPLQDNGGATLTVALLCGSPAIDKGTSNGVTGILTTDQRGSGFARTFDDPAIPNATSGDGTDVGAFELQQTCPPPGPSPTPTVTPTHSECIGDCGGSRAVSISDLVTGVNIVLGSLSVTACPAFENARGNVDIAQLIKAVNNALNGCPS